MSPTSVNNYQLMLLSVCHRDNDRLWKFQLRLLDLSRSPFAGVRLCSF